MMRPALLALLVAAAGVVAAPLTISTPAQAQAGVYIGTAPPPPAYPPRNGAWGDRDRDGVPNWADPRNNNRGAWGDRDRDGVPNRYDRYDNRYARDRDRDGVPNRWDAAPNNPYWR